MRSARVKRKKSRKTSLLPSRRRRRSRSSDSASVAAALVGAIGTIAAAIFSTVGVAVGNKASGISLHINITVILIIIASFAALLIITLVFVLFRSSTIKRRKTISDRLSRPDLQAITKFVSQELDLLSVLSKDDEK